MKQNLFRASVTAVCLASPLAQASLPDQTQTRAATEERGDQMRALLYLLQTGAVRITSDGRIEPAINGTRLIDELRARGLIDAHQTADGRSQCRGGG